MKIKNFFFKQATELHRYTNSDLFAISGYMFRPFNEAKIRLSHYKKISKPHFTYIYITYQFNVEVRYHKNGKK